MLDLLSFLGVAFAFLVSIAMLVRYERRLSRWIVRGSRKRRKPFVA